MAVANAEQAARFGIELAAVRAAETVMRKMVVQDFQLCTSAYQVLLDTLQKRAQTAAQLKGQRSRTLKDRIAELRGARKKGTPWVSREKVRRLVVVNEGHGSSTDRPGDARVNLLTALSMAPPTMMPGTIRSERDFLAAQESIAHYSAVRTTALRAVWDAQSTEACETAANEMYVTVATELELRACLLLQPFNGRVGAAKVQRQLIGHVCRGCRQQRTALAAGLTAVSGFDPMGYLGSGFDALEDPGLQFVVQTIELSGPFLTTSPTCDLMAQVINFAHVCGLGPCPAEEADPTADEHMAQDALRLMAALSGPVSEINAQLGVFLSDRKRDFCEQQHATPSVSSSKVRDFRSHSLRVPVGWPRPLVDPIARPEFIWVVPRDRQWRMVNGWHSGTGLPPTLDVAASVIPARGEVLPSVTLLQHIRDDYIKSVSQSPALAPALFALLEAESQTDEQKRQVAWYASLALATAEAAGPSGSPL